MGDQSGVSSEIGGQAFRHGADPMAEIAVSAREKDGTEPVPPRTPISRSTFTYYFDQNPLKSREAMEVENMARPICHSFYQQIHYLDDRIPVLVNWIRYPPPHNKIKKGLWLGYHPDVEFQFIVQGKGAYFIGRQEYPFERNSFLIVFPNEHHFWKSAPGDCVEKISLIFQRRYAADILGKADFLNIMPHWLKLNDAEAPLIKMLSAEMAEEQKQKMSLWPEAVQAKLNQIIVLIKRASQRKQMPARVNPLATQVLGWIENSFSKSDSVADMAAHFGYSADYLSRCFKQAVGTGIKHYILQRRIVEAQKILENKPYIKVNNIAEIVGFCQFNMFNRAFKIVVGMTPSAYRGFYHQQAGK
ncbi:MAG: AraC family transcriptional regulator [Kiritimatiellae bacterium]|nr:AraC family transcriptional regulator [Kiritimatiellia bacterium]